MFNKLLGLGVIIMASQLTTAAYGVKTKILDFEAEGFSSKIWSSIPISQEKIKESLGFVEDADVSESPYIQSKAFEVFHTDITNKLKDKKFRPFAESCKKLYEESDSAARVAIQLLLKVVAEKYMSDIQKAETLRPSSEDMPTKKESEESKRNFLDLLLNADKDITIRPLHKG